MNRFFKRFNHIYWIKLAANICALDVCPIVLTKKVGIIEIELSHRIILAPIYIIFDNLPSNQDNYYL